jgi:hypothetical protein
MAMFASVWVLIPIVLPFLSFFVHHILSIGEQLIVWPMHAVASCIKNFGAVQFLPFCGLAVLQSLGNN